MKRDLLKYNIMVILPCSTKIYVSSIKIHSGRFQRASFRACSYREVRHKLKLHKRYKETNSSLEFMLRQLAVFMPELLRTLIIAYAHPLLEVYKVVSTLCFRTDTVLLDQTTWWRIDLNERITMADFNTWA